MKYVKLIIILMAISLITTGCIKDDIEQYKIGNKAKEYFANKYDVKKSKIKIKANYFYGPNKRCWMSCGENKATIIYNEKEYKILYDETSETYGDDYQYEEIYNDLQKYLSDKFSYAKNIKINYLEYDVLSTPTKYNGDIKDYIKNTIVRKSVENSSSVWIKIWIEATDEKQAKELHNKYKKELLTELNDFNISYQITFAKEEDDNEYFAYYYYNYSDGGRSPAFLFYDRVDLTTDNKARGRSCSHGSATYNGDKLVCNN